MSIRAFFCITFPLLLLLSIWWIVSRSYLPPADFTFCNGTEIKTVDPAKVNGSPEGRIIDALFEGLVRLHPQTRVPLPGIATHWDISDDGRVYTFHLRKNAKWSDGSPVTAHDFAYSMRRFLDPMTAAEYASECWYVVNAKKYNLGSCGIEVGDPVEVELLARPDGALPHARGELLLGKLVEIIGDRNCGAKKEDDENKPPVVFVVELYGEKRKFQLDDGKKKPKKGIELCNQILFDFREVGIRAIDDTTFETTLNNPIEYWLQLMGFYPLLPVNAECLETHGPEWTAPENIVSNGAYRLKLRRIRDRIRMVKSETFWDKENIRINVVDAVAIDSVTTAFNLYETGKIDWIVTAPSLVTKELLAKEPRRNDLNPQPYSGCYYYMLNTTRPPLDDVRVRRALSLALDRAEIARAVLGANEPSARSLVPPGMPNYTPQLCPEENVVEARRLLAEAGYPEGKGMPKLDILYNNNEAHQAIAEVIRKQWQRNLGITAPTRNEEWQSYSANLRQLNYTVARRAWIGDYLDPVTFLGMYLTGGENNRTGWSSPEYDQLIESAQAESDPKVRREYLEKAERMLMDELPILPIYHYMSKNMVKPHVRGFYNNFQDKHPLNSMWLDRKSGETNEYMKGAE